MVPEDTPTGAHECPHCGEVVPSSGKGFLIHVNENPDCEADPDARHDRAGGGTHGGWPG